MFRLEEKKWDGEVPTDCFSNTLHYKHMLYQYIIVLGWRECFKEFLSLLTWFWWRPVCWGGLPAAGVSLWAVCTPGIHPSWGYDLLSDRFCDKSQTHVSMQIRYEHITSQFINHINIYFNRLNLNYHGTAGTETTNGPDDAKWWWEMVW